MESPTPLKDNIELIKKLDGPTLQLLIGALADRAASAMEPPPGLSPEDLFMSLDPAVRRWLHSLGNEENAVVRRWLLKMNDEKVALFEDMLRDYKSAKSWGKIIRIVGGALVVMITSVYGVAKAAPDVMDWMRRLLFK